MKREDSSIYKTLQGQEFLNTLLTFSTIKMPSIERKPRTLYDKVLRDHIVDERRDGTILLYIGTVVVSLWLCNTWFNHDRQTDISFMKSLPQ